MYWATGLPGRRRSNQIGFPGVPSGAPYTTEQELDLLKNQADAMKAELDAVNARLQELRGRGVGTV